MIVIGLRKKYKNKNNNQTPTFGCLTAVLVYLTSQLAIARNIFIFLLMMIFGVQKQIQQPIFQTTGLYGYRLSDRKMRKTIRLSDIGFKIQIIGLSDIA